MHFIAAFSKGSKIVLTILRHGSKLLLNDGTQ